MKAPRLRAWHKELKFMEYPESIFTRDSIHMLLNEEDYIWMRSTELKDKDGKEIYEGDILKNKDFMGRDEIHEVIFDESQASECVDCNVEPHFIIGLSLGSGFYETYTRFDGKIVYSQSEIIGNIYENPGLMEK